MGVVKKTLIGLLAASIASYGIYFCKKPDYNVKLLKETGKIAYDTIADNSPKIGKDELYIDLHVHLYKPSRYEKGIEEIVDKAMEKLDIIAIMMHDQSEGELDYATFKQEAKMNPRYKVNDYGNYFEIKTGNDRLVVIKGQELSTKEALDVLAIGCDGTIEPCQSIDKTIMDVQKQGGIAVIAHPMTMSQEGFMLFKIANEKDAKRLEEVYNLADAIEEFNSCNYLWMYLSNIKANMFAEKYRKPSIAASDTHYDLEQIGQAGIIVKSSQLSTDDLIKDLKTAIRNKEFKMHKEYITPLSFFKLVQKYLEWNKHSSSQVHPLTLGV